MWVRRRLALARAMRRRLALAPARVRLKSEQLAIRVFERGLDIEGKAFEPEHDHPDRVDYGPSPWWTLPQALRYLGVSDRDTFIDFGCGKGRVVHQAARRPFRRVIGVEISPALAEIARANLATRRHRHRCPNVEIVVADAKEFRVPDDLTIAYFGHPFTGETLRGGPPRHRRLHRSPPAACPAHLPGAPRCGGARDREISALVGATEQGSRVPGRDLRESLSGHEDYGISEYLVQPPSGRAT